MEELRYEHKMTPSTRILKMRSIKSPFYKHPPIAEMRRAKTPNNLSLHSINHPKEQAGVDDYLFVNGSDDG